MTITGLSGKIGSGKSFEQFRYVLEQAEKKQLQVVTNFSINFPTLVAYAKHKKYWWILHLIDKGRFTVLDALNSLEDLLDYPNSMIAFDEAGIFLNSREFSKTPKKLLMDLCQSRKFNANLVWASQFDTQVDLQFRNLTQYWIHCNGTSRYDKKLKRPRLIWKCYYYFDADSYNVWIHDSKARASYVKTRFLHAYQCREGWLTKADKLLFNCFDSFARLDKQQQSVRFASGPNCPLPKDYYFEKLGSTYTSELDPFSKLYKAPPPPEPVEVPSNWVDCGSGVSVYSATKNSSFVTPVKSSKLSRFRNHPATAQVKSYHLPHNDLENAVASEEFVHF